ncbi:MAG TPA: ATP-grasp domain-containing protein [Candidatus Bathyarchaeia archaeon]
MQILVYEYVSGGGYAASQIPVSPLAEGYAMLRALVADFKAAGHFIAIVLDSRLAAFYPPLYVDCTTKVSSRFESMAAFETGAKAAEAVYVVAPETDGLLESFVQKAEKAGVASLNSDSAAIKTTVNKPLLKEHIKDLRFATPNSLVFHTHDSIEEIVGDIRKELAFPLIFKPADGVGCSALSVVNDERQVESAIAKLSSYSALLVQEFVRGIPASVSVYSTGGEALPVSLNQQNVSLETPETDSSYYGGTIPLDHSSKEKAFSVAKKIVESIGGLRGYIGVDMVLTEDKPVVIEVNPRLTTSYIGLRMVSGFNPGQALADSVLRRKLPVNCETFGYACFAKVKTPKPNKEQLFKTYGLSGVFAPPFPFPSDSSAIALVTSHGETLQTASSRLDKNKRRLLKTLSNKVNR